MQKRALRMYLAGSMNRHGARMLNPGMPHQALEQARDSVLQSVKVVGCEPLIAGVRREPQAMSAIQEQYFRDLDSDAWAVRESAFNELFRNGADAVETLVAGASYSRPKVRAACIALMDHLGDARCCEALERALRDPSPLVRRHAVHAVGCQKCKSHPLRMDIVGAIVERMLGDSSPRVRRVAAHQIGLQPYDLRAIEALQHVIAVSLDAGLVSRARRALCDQMAHAEPRCAANS